MNQCFRLQNLRAAVFAVLLPLLGGRATLAAQNHVVSPAEMRQAMVAAGEARQKNLESVQSFASIPSAKKALTATGMSEKQFQTAVSNLSDEELSRFASRAQSAQADFAAGRITERDLLLILVGFVALILIIVAVR